jgi:hypothetical protein
MMSITWHQDVKAAECNAYEKSKPTGRSLCHVRCGAFLVCGSVTVYYLKAMGRVSASGPSAARARSRNIAVSEIRRSGLAAGVSVGGCAGCGDNDDRY